MQREIEAAFDLHSDHCVLVRVLFGRMLEEVTDGRHEDVKASLGTSDVLLRPRQNPFHDKRHILNGGASVWVVEENHKTVTR